MGASTFRAWIRVECGAGTYIRSLIRDIGHALNCPATMSFLVRTHSGHFSIDDAVLPQNLGAATPFSLHTALQWCATREIVTDAGAQRLAHGQKAMIEAGAILNIQQGERVLIRDRNRTIFALAVPDEIGANAQEGGRFRAEKVFFSDSEASPEPSGLLV